MFITICLLALALTWCHYIARTPHKNNNRRNTVDNITLIEQLQQAGNELATALQLLIDAGSETGSNMAQEKATVANWTICHALAQKHDPFEETRGLFELILKIRMAAGDPFGKLMQDELVSLVQLQCDKTAQLNQLFITLQNRLPADMRRDIRDWTDILIAVARLSDEHTGTHQAKVQAKAVAH